MRKWTTPTLTWNKSVASLYFNFHCMGILTFKFEIHTKRQISFTFPGNSSPPSWSSEWNLCVSGKWMEHHRALERFQCRVLMCNRIAVAHTAGISASSFLRKSSMEFWNRAIHLLKIDWNVLVIFIHFGIIILLTFSFCPLMHHKWSVQAQVA